MEVNRSDQDGSQSPCEDSHELNEPMKERKKRFRLPNSCVVCRRRKIKCDKARPSCKECTKRNIPHLCAYEDPPWLKHPAATNETPSVEPPGKENVPGPPQTHFRQAPDINELLMRVKHVEASINLTEWLGPQQNPTPPKATAIFPPNKLYDPTEVVDHCDSFPFLVPFIMRKARIEYNGAMSAYHITKRDMHFKIIWIYMWTNMEKALRARAHPKLGIQPSTSASNAVNVVLVHFLELRRLKVQLKKNIKRLRSSQQSLDALILEKLPKRRVILSLLTKFFRELYALMPFVDQHTFMERDLKNILSVFYIEGWDKNVEHLNITDKYDYATLAILFLIMAITSLAITEKEYDNNPDANELKKHCPAIYAEVAWQCLSQFDFLNKSYNLQVVQALLLMKIYYQYCPQDDTTTDQSLGRIMLGTILSVATSAGLHVEPSQLSGNTNPERWSSWRKVWHRLMDMDTVEAVMIGTVPRFTNNETYDTELPLPAPGMGEVEMFLVDDYKFMERKTALFRRICMVVFQRGKPHCIAQLMELCDELKKFREAELVGLDHILKKYAKPYTRVRRVMQLLELKTLELSMRNLLMSHFHRKNNHRMVYHMFVDCLCSLSTVLSDILNVLHNQESYFGMCYSFFIRPTMLAAAAICFALYAGLFSRCLQTLKLVPMTDRIRLGKVRELERAILTNMDLAKQILMKLNLGHYNSQRISLAFNFFFKLIKDPSFDFDKAVKFVTVEASNDPSTEPAHILHGIKPSDVPTANFMMLILDSELDFLTSLIDIDLTEVLRPHTEPDSYIPLIGSQLFSSNSKSHMYNIYHFGPLEDSTVGSQNADGEEVLHRSINVGSHVIPSKISHFFAEGHTNQSVGQVPPLDLREATYEEEDVPMALTTEEFAELFGVFDSDVFASAALSGA